MPTSWIESGLPLVTWIQNLGGWLLAPMRFFTFLGAEEFYLLVAPAIIWCLDAALGLRLGLFLMISGGLNNSLKLLLHGPRPFWVDPQARALVLEASFGIPSGHAQNAVTVWGLLAFALRRLWAWLVAVLLIASIGFSRLYLGVHFPADVIAGWLVGVLLLASLLRLEPGVRAWLAARSAGDQILAALMASMSLVILGSLARLSLARWVLPFQWIENAGAVFPGEIINPYALDGLISNAGAFFGLATGAIWLRSLGGFQVGGPVGQRLLRYPLGLLGVLLIWYGLGQIFPRGDDLISYTLRYLRYALVGGWISGLAPLLFVRFGLAKTGD